MDTIYALASARGKSGVAVIRMSGSASHDIAFRLAGPLPETRKAGLRRLVWNGVELDQALVLKFDAGRSFTGEESVEFHLHGGQAVVVSVLRALSEQPEARLAEAGEFTRRALENGQLDLTQVEGLADLIDAETEAQRVQALRVLSGAIGQKVDGWRRSIIRARALIEATIDFADEDVPVDVGPEVLSLIDSLLADLQGEALSAVAAERIRDGFEVAIVGAPNVGKSTLLNALAGRKAAITSEVAGTTRDVIEVRMDLGGLPVTMLDTAGIRDTTDLVEGLGIEAARGRAQAADLRVFLGDGELVGIKPRKNDIFVAAKADLYKGDGPRVSGLTGEGVGELVERISIVLQDLISSPGILIRERHRLAVSNAIDALVSARREMAGVGGRAEIVALDLRQAARALEFLVGRVDVEALLGEIFVSFCIGK